MVAFNVFTARPRRVFPPTPHAVADTYDLMLTQSAGPRCIPFNHVNTHDETVVMVKGGYTMRVGAKRVAMRTGDVMIIPKGTAHGDIETGPRGYRALQIESNVQRPSGARLVDFSA